MADFTAHYQTPEPNVAIPLYSGPITLQDGRGSVTGEGTIELRWLPDPEIGYSIPDVPLASGGPCMGLGTSDLRLRVPDAIEAVPILMTGQNIGSHRPFSVRGLLNGPLHIGQRVPLASVELRLANFSYLLPPHMYLEGNKGVRVDPIRWEIDGWVITLAAMPELSQLVEKVKTVGGYILTHQVKLERIDSACFSIEEAEVLTDRLFQFFCFAQGRCINLILPVGYDADGKAVWQKWALWHISRWKWSESWVDKWYANRIADAFKGFIERCKTPDWKETVDLSCTGMLRATTPFR